MCPRARGDVAAFCILVLIESFCCLIGSIMKRSKPLLLSILVWSFIRKWPCWSHLPITTIPDLEDSDDDISEIQQEIAHLAQCDSEYVTKYYGSFVKGYKLWIGSLIWLFTYSAVINKLTLSSVMEYLAGGSCLDLV